MIFDWYKVFNADEFVALGLTSREMIVLLESIGRSSILISRGNTLSMVFKDVYLPVGNAAATPYVDGGFASYVDLDKNVWLGVEVAS